jgi:hypothetical protein
MNASKLVIGGLCAVALTLTGCNKGPNTPPPEPKVDTITPTQPANPGKPSLPEAKDPAEPRK